MPYGLAPAISTGTSRFDPFGVVTSMGAPRFRLRTSVPSGRNNGRIDYRIKRASHAWIPPRYRLSAGSAKTDRALPLL
jgi:hypothetical protein